MSTLNVALGIWLRTITLFAFMVGICSLFEAGVFAVAIVFLVFIGALVCTSPLLILLCLLVDMLVSLHYSWRAKFAWFTFMLMVIVAGIFVAAAFLLQVGDSPDIALYYGAGCAGLAVLIALYFSKNALKRLDQLEEHAKEMLNNIQHI